MNDNELDDLFQSNADYLADQPPRDFDKEAFWQHMQTALPSKVGRRKKTRVWGWAAAAVLLAGIFGGIGWVQMNNGVDNPKSAQKSEPVPAIKNAEPIAKVPPAITQSRFVSPTHEGKRSPRLREKIMQKVPIHAEILSIEPETLAIREYSNPESLRKDTHSLPEIVIPITPEKPHQRVVHINEIRAQQQQETKARTRMAFRVGLPSGSRLTTQSDRPSPLSIPIQN